jgi:hypothetical protein
MRDFLFQEAGKSREQATTGRRDKKETSYKISIVQVSLV